MPKWLKEAGPESDIVMSSRVRLARNIEGYPFPHNLDKEKGEEIVKKVYHTVIEGNYSLKNDVSLIHIKDLDKIERLIYIEKHLISPDLAYNNRTGSLLVNKEETISIMLNEEDHIRIQCLLPGLQLENVMDLANKVDDLIEEKLKYAYSEEFGYLTSCPTNLGTGIRVSVMIHLPALGMTNYIKKMLRAASQIGLAVRGIYGEGTEYLGNLYQISNQVTLGLTEDEIVSNLQGVVMQIIQKERAARQELLKERRTELEDRVFRSFGILKNARMITSNEAMKLISDVKLGVNLNLIQEVNLEKLNQLIGMIQPGYLQKHYHRQLDEGERDIKRAELIRKLL